MMNKNALLALPLLALFATGCAASSNEDGNTVPTATADATAGLSISAQRADLVRGSLVRGAGAIAFEFRLVGGAHHSKVWDSGGTLLESTLADGYEDTSYLGGRARVRGSLSDAEPTIDGDAKIFEALNAHPNAPLFFDLRDALLAANVPRDLFAPKRSEGDLAPRYWNRGTFTIGRGQQIVIGTTWQSWVSTEFTFWAAGFDAARPCLQALTGWSPEVCNSVFPNGGFWTTGARYYGYSVRVSNRTAVVNGGSSVDVAVNVVEK